MPRSLSLLVPNHVAKGFGVDRIALFAGWLALAAWFCLTHVFSRDEVRAFSLALSGPNVLEMLHNVHGEGHPALWYLILRSGHDLFPYREVLPVAAALIAISAMAILTFCSPFRSAIVGIVLFSFYGAFEYVAVARNYGLSVLVMFSIAALYSRTRNTLWFGLLVAILCNTNVPSCFLAAGFLLFRFVELLTEKPSPARRDVLIFIGNALLAAVGAYLCFRTVYPTFNDMAVSPHLQHLDAAGIANGLIDRTWGFSHLGFNGFLPLPMDAILLAISCLGLVSRPAAIAAAITALLALKLFFYFVYVSYYRHEVLYLMFLLSLFWLAAEGAGGTWPTTRLQEKAQFVGIAAFAALLIFQTARLIVPVKAQFSGAPFSRAADVGRLLQRPELSNAIVMGDPDTMLEPLPYYASNPLWFVRQQRFGKVVRLSNDARRALTLGDVLADAERLHQQTGRPIVFLSHLELHAGQVIERRMMFNDTTILSPGDVKHFRSSTRLIASLRPSESDEDYDVYVYPR